MAGKKSRRAILALSYITQEAGSLFYFSFSLNGLKKLGVAIQVLIIGFALYAARLRIILKQLLFFFAKLRKRYSEFRRIPALNEEYGILHFTPMKASE